jgi:ERCC4-type nuclease
MIAGGDLDGRVLDLPVRWSELAFGRGPWHGTDQAVQNDLIVADTTEFVSRRAGRLFRAGVLLEVASLDQGDELVVKRKGGEAVRPARTARGRVVLRAGDAIELGNGRGAAVRLVVERVAR